jgi:aspartate/methionine/tyrosine aminotransferase
VSAVLNPDLCDTATPPIPEAVGWLQAYDGRNGAPINLAQAVPGAPPPELLARLAHAAGDASSARYGPIMGDPALVSAYAENVADVYGAAPSPREIAITSGCNEAFFVTVLALAKAGDAILLPAPWYFNHAMTLRMLGIMAVPLPTHAKRGFVPDPLEVEAALQRHKRQYPSVPVRALVLVTPNNPTGAIAPPTVIHALADVAARHQCWLVLDETYRDFRADPAAAPHDLFRHPEARARLIQLYSFSKAFAVPGHRVGALIAPAAAMAEIAKVLDCMQICAPRAAQTALAWAIPALGAWRQATAQAVSKRGAFFAEGMAAASGWRIEAIGAYFAYVRHPWADATSVEVARRLAQTAGVLALPGSYFGPGQDEFLRFAYANTDAAGAAATGSRIARHASGA